MVTVHSAILGLPTTYALALLRPRVLLMRHSYNKDLQETVGVLIAITAATLNPAADGLL